MGIEQLGLTNYGARVYEALLKADSADAFTIAQRSGVPTGRIYSVLSELERKKIVEVQNTRPKLFRAVEPNVAIGRLRDSYRRELDTGFEAYCERAAAIEKKLARKPERDGSIFWTVAVEKTRFPEFVKSREGLVKKELLVCAGGLDTEDYQNIDKFAGTFLNNLGRGVQVRLLLSNEDKQKILRIAESALVPMGKPGPKGGYASIRSLAKYLGKSFQLRFSEDLSAPFDVIDDTEVVIKVRNPAKSREYFAIIAVRDPRMAQELKKKFLEMWGKAEEISLGAFGAKK